MDRSPPSLVTDPDVDGLLGADPTRSNGVAGIARERMPSTATNHVEKRPSTSTAAPSAPQMREARWSPLTRIAFRFALIYLTIYSFPGPAAVLPPVRLAFAWWDRMWFELVPWIGEHVLRLATPITVMPNGSGDTTFNYVQVLCYLVIALAGTLAWSVVGELRGRAAYPRLHDLLRIYVRYTVASSMLGYGLAKVFVSQFPPPTADQLLQPYGESSPMGILWTFMGASAAYTIFAGLAETIGGVLLLFRRTTLLGSMIVVAVMTNVVMLNFCYDVPVKLYSSHLLVMALFLLLPDAGRLANVILLNRAARPRSIGWPWPQRRLWWARLVIKIGFIGLVGVREVAMHDLLDVVVKEEQSFEGTYEVDVFTRDGETIPPLLTDGSRWRHVSVNRRGFMSIRRMNGPAKWLRATIAPATGTVVLSTHDGRTVGSLAYGETGVGQLVVEGMVDGAEITATLRRIDESSFLLMNRGFHWINEYPFNR